MVTLTWTQNSVYIFRKSALDSSVQGDLRLKHNWKMLLRSLSVMDCATEDSRKPCSVAFVAPDGTQNASTQIAAPDLPRELQPLSGC